MSFGYYNSPIGKIKIEAEGEYIVGVNFINVNNKTLLESNKECNCLNDDLEELSEIIIKCKEQLKEYFSGERKDFNLKVKFTEGTDFQKTVWEELKKIQYGETVSYKEMAKRVNNPKACRAIGAANNKNPISIIVPCHRVIGENGKMVGYAEGIDKKEFLLNLESINKL